VFDIKSLSYYSCARQTGSLTIAAKELGVSVAAISAGIQRLESLLCVPLLLRTSKGILPAAGTETVLRFCLLLLSGLHRIETAFGEGNAPIDFAQLEAKTDAMMALDEALLPFLRECSSLRLSPILLFRFIAVYEQGSINRAANILGIAQPQVSRQIREIEDMLGTPMFDRKNRGLKILRGAEILYAGAIQLNDICERVIKRSDLLFTQEVKTTRLGCIPPLGTESALCNLISDICVHWPQVDPKGHIRISSASANQLITRLKANELHAVIVDTPRGADGFAERILARNQLRLAGNQLNLETLNGLAELDQVRHLLKTRALVLPSSDTGLRVLIDQWLERYELKAHKIIEVESMTIVAALTRNANFISLLPAFPFLDDDGAIETYDLPNSPLLIQRLIWNSEASHSRPIIHLNHILDRRLAPDGNHHQ
jgi:DNA-binding transcriptional LysR family regulator